MIGLCIFFCPTLQHDKLAENGLGLVKCLWWRWVMVLKRYEFSKISLQRKKYTFFFFTVKLLTSDVNDVKYHFATLWFLNTCSFTLLVKKNSGKNLGSV